VGIGDRVLLAAPNSSAFVCAYFAAQLLGAVAVPFDPNSPKAARDDLIGRIRPKLAFGEKEAAHADPPSMRDYSELESLPWSEAEFTPPALDSLAELVFTTGTTRQPKGVCLTHRNLVAAACQINSVMGTRESDVEVMPLPLFRTFGLARLRCNLIAGSTLVLVGGFSLPGEIFTAIDRHRATGLAGVPAGFAVLLHFGERGLGAFADRLRYIEIGSAPMPIEHKRALMDLLPKTELWMHYGLSEAARSAFIEFHRHHERLDTVGLPAPGVQVAVRGEDGLVCHSGVAGQLWIRGEHVSPGYWGDPESTARSFVDGWVHSGDVAHLENDGFLVLHGRNDDMINVGGFKVLPDQIEGVLSEHPAVLEAMCIGVPDPRKITGQVVRAYLVSASAKASDEELSRWVAARLERYKVPVQYTWIEALPRTSSGKLMRRVLRNQAASEL
jgi:long-chain acyl-CoA synthetase